MHVGVHECETWSLTLREEPWLRTFVQRVLRKILGPKREEVTQGLRKPHNEATNDFYAYSSQNVIREIKPRRAHVGRAHPYSVLVGNVKDSEHL
jgi:hypothetical protein